MRGRTSPIVVGIDLGGTKTAGAAAGLDGAILCRLTIRTASEAGPEGVVAQMADLAETLARGAGRRLEDVAAVGLGAPGPTGVTDGVVFDAPNLRGWRDVPLKAMLESRLGRPVHLDNDANAAAVAEHLWGAGKGVDDLVYVTVSTGIGGGLVLAGHLYRGAAETAGEFGHTTVDADGPPCYCGNRGCLEALASGTAIARQAVSEIEAGAPTTIPSLVGGNLAAVSAETVERAARQGDSLALRVLTRAGEYLGVGFANLVNLLAPRLIVVGGGVARAGDLVLGPARRVLADRAFRRPASIVRVVESPLGQDAGLLGAIALGLGCDYPFAREPAAKAARPGDNTRNSERSRACQSR